MYNSQFFYLCGEVAIVGLIGVFNLVFLIAVLFEVKKRDRDEGNK